MNSASQEMVARLREVRSRNLPIDLYARELAKIAGIASGADELSEKDPAIGHMRSLDRRLCSLEKRIAALEAQK